MKTFTEAEILSAIKDSYGVLSTVARRLGIAWDTARKRIAELPAAVEALDVEKSALCSLAVEGLVEQVRAGDRHAIARVFDSRGAPQDGLNIIKESKTEISGTVNHRVGVMLIPQDLSVDEWQAQAEGAQAKLMADARLPEDD